MRLLLKYLFGLIFLVLISINQKIEWNSLLKFEEIGCLGIGALLLSVNFLVMNYRWHILLNGLGVKSTFKNSNKICLISEFFHFLLPGAFSGDLLKTIYFSKDLSGKVIASVFFDRFLGFLALTLFFVGALFFAVDTFSKFGFLESGNVWPLLVLFGAILFLFLVLVGRVPFLRRVSLDFLTSIRQYSRSRDLSIVSFGLSLFSQVLTVFSIYFFSLSYGVNLPLSLYFIAVPVGTILMTLPISPGGVGVTQFSYLALFELILGRPETSGLFAITLFQIFHLLVGFAAYMVFRMPRRLEFSRMREDCI